MHFLRLVLLRALGIVGFFVLIPAMVPGATAARAEAAPGVCPRPAPIRLAEAPPAPVPLAELVQPSLGLKFDPVLNLEPPSTSSETPVYIFGRQIDGQTDDLLSARGDAEFRKLGMFIKGDYIQHDLVQDELFAEGSVKLFREGEFYEGPRLRIKLGTNQGFFDQVRYELNSAGGHGSARFAAFVQPMETRLEQATFTTCPRDRPAWELRMSELVVDQIREVGQTRSSYLYWGDTPIMPLGNLSFPLSNRRKTGFLSPSYGVSTRLGFEVEVPFYWNIAPQHDLTLYPKVMSRRGVKLDTEFRFLRPSRLGTIAYEILPNDRVEKKTREFTSIIATQRLASGWSLGLNASRASDDRYFSDFGQSLLGASQRILPAHLTLSGRLLGWNAQAEVQEYQLLQDVNAPLLQPYSWMPRLALSRTHRADPRTDRLPIEWSGFTELTSYQHPTLAQGERFVASGSMLYRHVYRGFYLTPKVSLHGTHYAHGRDGDAAKTNKKYSSAPLGIYTNNVGSATESYTRVLPSFGLDLSTILERDVVIGGRGMEQTLEPKISYLYTPYRDQSKLPVFDTGAPSLNFAQIFSDAAFNGQDRIADLNQVTLGLTSRFIEKDTGAERIRASVGQRFYFSDQQVTLPGAAARTDRESDILGQVSARITAAWSLDINGQYTGTGRFWRTGSVVSRYSPRPGSTLSAGYRYVRGSSHTLDLAFQWPIARHWYAVGRYNTSFRDLGGGVPNQRSGEIESLAGLEYDGGCWVARLVAQRFVTGARERNTAVFFQIELNGLARVGTNPLGALTRSIPNYQMINQLSPLPSKFDNFQ